MKPLDQIIDGLLVLMKQYHYSEISITTYQREWKKLSEFLQETYNSTLFSMERGMAYLEKRFGIVTKYNDGTLSQQKVQMLRIIHMLEDYQLHGVLLNRCYASKNPIVLPPTLNTIFQQFTKYIELSPLSKCTKDHYVSITLEFLDFLAQKGLQSLEMLDYLLCTAYVNTLGKYSFKTVEQKLCGVRYFLRYLNTCGILKDDIAAQISMPHISKTATIPSVWKPEEIKKLLSAIDRTGPTGKRDYAMILLAVVLGIRVGDIKQLRFSNFDWSQNQLQFVQHKTHKPVTLPLPRAVGWAVIDYIKNGRPTVSSTDLVFIKHVPPFSGFSDNDHLTGRITFYMQKAGIKKDKNRHCGFHSMRHTTGSVLLEENVPIETIRDILGHSDVDVTAVYLKTDIENLRECLLDSGEWDYAITTTS